LGGAGVPKLGKTGKPPTKRKRKRQITVKDIGKKRDSKEEDKDDSTVLNRFTIRKTRGGRVGKVSEGKRNVK